MQKTFSILFALLVCNAMMWAQNCPRPTGLIPFQGNQVRYTVKVGAPFTFTCATANPNFRADTTAPNVASLFASGLWLGSTDSTGQQYIAADTYGSCRASGADYSAGPIDANGAAVCSGYDKVWSVRRYALLALIADFNDNGIINNPVHPDIMGFPCRRNPHFSAYNNGTVLVPNRDFAVFKDQNNDGIYNPLEGDYPIIPGTNGSVLPEQLSWMVFNDVGEYHLETGIGPKLGMEVQVTNYSFSCPDPLIDRTTFVSYKIRNMSNITQNLSAGIWLDPDLGCSADDYIGCTPSTNTTYVYNADNNDDVNCPGGGLGFGTNPPVQAVTFLNKTMASSVVFNRGGTSQTADPTQAGEYFNLLRGLYKDGSSFLACDGVTPTTFAYPDNPNLSGGCSMRSANIPQSDYRSISATQPTWLMPSETMVLTLALSYHRAAGFNHLQNVDKMYADIPLLQQFYNNGYVGACIQPINLCSSDCVYPGDTNKDGEVNGLDILYMGCSYNNVGAGRSDRSSIFQPTTAAAWTQTNLVNNLNRKHQDCNGDGAVNQSDINTINSNLGLRNANYTNITYTPAGTALSLESNTAANPNLDTISSASSNIPVKIRLNGDNGNIQDFYGVSFHLEVTNDTVMQILAGVGANNQIFSNLSPQFGSGLDPNIYLIQYKSKLLPNSVTNHKSIDVVIMRKDGQNFTGNAIDLLTFKLKKGSITPNRNTSYARFSNVRMIKNDGTILAYGAKDQRIVFNTIVSTTETDTPLSFSLYPNPAQTQFTLTKPTADAAKLSITDLAGRSIYTQLLSQNDTIIATENWQNGVYLVVIEENGSRAVQKIVVLH
jgi:Secretion system C-terminal sorting domain/Dockerin type I domain